MSVKLRELIRAIRACKTAAEERAVVTKECALCRTAFASSDEKAVRNRHRNVAKLLYIHMLGYPTHFAQMEALKLIVSNSFPEKRIGYLGLMLLLDERQGVLMLVTNSLKQDFTSKNPFIAGLALASVGNISSADMARDLADEVEKFFHNSNPYLRKKATLTAIRCIRKVPELIEDFVPGVVSLLSDKNHAVQLSAVALMIEMVKLDDTVLEQFKKMARTIVRLLKNLRTHVSEYDISGVIDPFLQCKLIRLLRLLGEGDREASEYMNDVLAEVCIGTEAAKNPGYAVLYETVMTVMSIEAEGGLRVIAINILGRFLLNRDNNIRYVALNTLCKVVERDTQAIQRHRNLIVDCLKDADISIRRRALDLIYALVTKSNVTALVKELLNYLALTSGDKEFKADLTEKIWNVVERYAPEPRWHIDTIIHVLLTAGKYAREHVITDLIALVSQQSDIYAYSVHKIFASARKFKHNQINITQVALWVIGEYGELLLTDEGAAEANAKLDDADENKFTPIAQDKVLDFISKVVKHPLATTLLREYALNALVKLSQRFDASRPRIQRMIARFGSSMELELQQRAIEYGVLASEQYAKLRSGIVARMPKMEVKRKKAAATKTAEKSGDDSSSSDSDGSGSSSGSDSSGDESDEETQTQPQQQQPAQQPAQTSAPVDLFGMSTPQPTPQPQQQPQQQAPDLLGDLFGTSTPQPQAQPQAPTQAQPANDDLNALFGMGAAQPTPQPAAPQFPPAVVHESKVISLTFNYSKSLDTPNSVEVKAVFQNKSPAALSGFEFQIAVPKYLKLELHPAASNAIAPHGQLTQSFQLLNTLPQKKMMIRMRINYQGNGQSMSEKAQFAAFP